MHYVLHPMQVNLITFQPDFWYCVYKFRTDMQTDGLEHNIIPRLLDSEGI